MFDYIMTFFRPNLTTVLGNFNKAIQDLDKIETLEAEKQAKASARIAKAEKARDEASQRHTQAAKVKSNLRNLIGAE